MTATQMPGGVSAISLGNSWVFQTSSEREVLPREGVEHMLAAVQQWTRHFPTEGTWVEREFGIPSLFVRFDCVYTGERGLEIFEIEDKPCGMYACSVLNIDFGNRLQQLVAEWPNFRWVQGARRESDDRGWLGEPMSLDEALRSRDLVLVRCMPDQPEFHDLRGRSVSTISTEGDKNYGVPMGLWNIVRPNGDGKLHPEFPKTGAFVLKPVQGTRCRDISICTNGPLEVKRIESRGEVPFLDGEEFIRSGRDTISLPNAGKRVRLWGGAVCQPYIKPLRRDHMPGRNVILRFYVGYSPKQKQWIPLGGAWLASTAARVHGEPDTISGPLTFE